MAETKLSSLTLDGLPASRVGSSLGLSSSTPRPKDPWAPGGEWRSGQQGWLLLFLPLHAHWQLSSQQQTQAGGRVDGVGGRNDNVL